MTTISKLIVFSVLMQLLTGCVVFRATLPPETKAILSLHYKRDTPVLGAYYIETGNRNGRGFEFHAGNLVLVFPEEGAPKRDVIPADDFISLLQEWDEISLMKFDGELFDYHKQPPSDSSAAHDLRAVEYSSRAVVIVDRRNSDLRALVICAPGYFRENFRHTEESRALAKAIEFEKKVRALVRLNTNGM